MKAREAYIALNMMESLGPVSARSLIRHLGDPEAVFSAGESRLRGAEGIGGERVAQILRQRDTVDPVAEEARARRIGARLVTPLDADYPESLKPLRDAPLALYVRGELRREDRQALAIVGSRRSTQYGRAATDRISFQLARLGFAVVSGLARGVDTAAHEGALKAGGRTVAVLGSALDRIYPPESVPLADRIAEQGAVVSEYTLGREPDKTTFPYRNRIISGLSMGVLVVECDVRSGALHTARYATEQGRLLFAVPGRIDSPMSHGPHRLLRDGAKLVEDVQDIVEEFEYLWPQIRAREAADPDAKKPELKIVLSPEEQAVAQALIEGPLGADELARSAGLTAARLSVVLMGLEMKRVVRLRPGRQVELAATPEGLAAPDADEE